MPRVAIADLRRIDGIPTAELQRAIGWIADKRRACGFGETIVASTSVTYAPVSASFSSVAIYFQVDGVQHKVLGARGTASFSLKRREIPVIKFEFTGLYSAVTDTALASPTYNATKPLPVNNVNTTGFALHGYAGVLSDLSIDMAMTVVHRDLVGGTQSVLITDREPTGSISIEAVTVATKDLWTIAQNATLGALALTQGTVAGNKVAISSSNVQLTNPSYTDQDGVQLLKLDMNFVPSTAGNDEISIICT